RLRYEMACLAEAGEGWRPGLDLNQDKEHCTAPASTLPPPGRRQHCRTCLSGAIPNRPLTLTRATSGSDGLACNESHAPRVVADIARRARGGKAGLGEFFLDFRLAVALQ